MKKRSEYRQDQGFDDSGGADVNDWRTHNRTPTRSHMIRDGNFLLQPPDARPH